MMKRSRSGNGSGRMGCSRIVSGGGDRKSSGREWGRGEFV